MRVVTNRVNRNQKRYETWASGRQFGNDLDHLVDIDELNPIFEGLSLFVPNEGRLGAPTEEGTYTLVVFLDELVSASHPQAGGEQAKFPSL